MDLKTYLKTSGVRQQDFAQVPSVRPIACLLHLVSARRSRWRENALCHTAAAS